MKIDLSNIDSKEFMVRNKPDVGLDLNNCPEAENIKCECGFNVSPHSYKKLLFGGFIYYYECDRCNKKYKLKR